MALHEITIHENTGASSELAPYLGSYAAKDTVRLDGFAEAVARQCGLPAIQAMAILTGSFDAMEELERDGLVRIHTDLGVVCGVIAGSFPTADAEFDPERNALCLALYLDDTVRLSLANVVPAIVLDGDVTRVRVDNVADIAQPKPYNVIHGQHTFRVAGHKLILSDEGASAYLTDAQGTVYPLVIDQVESDQLFRAHTAALLEPGDYKLVVASRGGEPDGDPQHPFRRVKYLRVVDPEPEPIAETRDGLVKVMSVADDETGDTFTYGDTWSVRGEGFTGTAPGWAVNMAFVQLEPEAEDPVVLDFDVRGAAEIKLDDKPEHPVAAGDYPDAKLLIEFCHPDGEDPETQVSETLEMPIHIVSNE